MTASKSKILGVKFIIVSLTFLMILVLDIELIKGILSHKDQLNAWQIRGWGLCLVFSGLLVGGSLINFKKFDTQSVLIYIGMALLFFLLPVIVFTDPLTMMEWIG